MPPEEYDEFFGKKVFRMNFWDATERRPGFLPDGALDSHKKWWLCSLEVVAILEVSPAH